MEFTALQRLSLEFLLGNQKGNISEMETIYDILKKIKLPDHEKDLYLKVLPDKILLDEKAMSDAEVLNVDLEKAERRKLLEVLDAHQGFGPADVEWVMPLKTQLKA